MLPDKCRCGGELSEDLAFRRDVTQSYDLPLPQRRFVCRSCGRSVTTGVEEGVALRAAFNEPLPRLMTLTCRRCHRSYRGRPHAKYCAPCRAIVKRATNRRAARRRYAKP